MEKTLTLCGIDPGYDRAGYAFLSVSGAKVSVLSYGLISTAKTSSFDSRLHELGVDFSKLFQAHNPDAIFMEKLFMGRNITTALPVAEVRGVLRYIAADRGTPFHEIPPKTVKKQITGYGNADKSQMIRAVTLILKLAEPPSPDDVADALAIAFCGYLSLPPQSR